MGLGDHHAKPASASRGPRDAVALAFFFVHVADHLVERVDPGVRAGAMIVVGRVVVPCASDAVVVDADADGQVFEAGPVSRLTPIQEIVGFGPARGDAGVHANGRALDDREALKGVGIVEGVDLSLGAERAGELPGLGDDGLHGALQGCAPVTPAAGMRA